MAEVELEELYREAAGADLAAAQRRDAVKGRREAILQGAGRTKGFSGRTRCFSEAIDAD